MNKIDIVHALMESKATKHKAGLAIGAYVAGTQPS